MRLLCSFAAAQSISAATFVVNTTVDTQDAAAGDGVCADSDGMYSMRTAISEANALAGADTITRLLIELRRAFAARD